MLYLFPNFSSTSSLIYSVLDEEWLSIEIFIPNCKCTIFEIPVKILHTGPDKCKNYTYWRSIKLAFLYLPDYVSALSKIQAIHQWVGYQGLLAP